MSRVPVTERDRERLRAHVLLRHPGAHLDFYEEGYDHTLVVADDSRAYRFPRSDFYAAKVRVEADFLRTFAPHSPLAVPRPEYREEPEPHSVYDFLPGAQFLRPAFDTYEVKQRAAAAEAIGTFLAAIHAFPIEDAQALGVEATSWWTSSKPFEDAREILPALEPTLRTKAERMLDERAEIVRTPPKVATLHYDFAGEHILHDGHALTAIIDFGDVAIGDPALDWRFGWEFGEDFLREAMESYPFERDAEFNARRYIYDALGLLRRLVRWMANGDPEVPRYIRDLERSFDLLDAC